MGLMLRLPSRGIRVRAMTPGEEPTMNGFYWPETKEIAIDPALPPRHQAEILIHEIIHAIWDARKMPKRVTEESACTHLGEALADVMARTPELLWALRQALLNNEPIVEGE